MLFKPIFKQRWLTLKSAEERWRALKYAEVRWRALNNVGLTDVANVDLHSQYQMGYWLE